MAWEPSSKFCASSAHMGWAAACFLAVLAHGLSLQYCVPIFVAYALLKEYWADLTWLEHDSLAGTTLDFLTYMMGMGLGILGFYYLWAALATAIVVLIVAAAIDYEIHSYSPLD